MKSRDHWSFSRQKRSSKLSLQSLHEHALFLVIFWFWCWHHSCASNVSGQEKIRELSPYFLLLRNIIAHEDFFCTSNRKLLTTCSPGNETSFTTIIPTCSVPFNTCYTSCKWWVIVPHESNVIIIIIIIATVSVTVVVSVIVIYSLRTKLFHSAWHCRICCLCPL